MEAGAMQSQPVSSPTAYNLPAAAYATPPVATLTSHGSPGAYSAFHRVPALLTRYTPPAQVSTHLTLPTRATFNTHRLLYTFHLLSMPWRAWFSSRDRGPG